MRLYALRDVKVGFLTPTVADSDAIATRQLQNAMRAGTGTLLDTHPEDFALYYIGTYDTASGAITPVLPELVVEAVSLIV